MLRSNRAVTPNVWRLTAFGNCDRHEIGEEVKVVVLGGPRYATPSPLTPQETREVIAAISQISPGSRVANVRRDPDGKVRAFLPGDPEGGQIVVVTNNSGDWRAAIEMELF